MGQNPAENVRLGHVLRLVAVLRCGLGRSCSHNPLCEQLGEEPAEAMQCVRTCEGLWCPSIGSPFTILIPVAGCVVVACM
jgi:hypothetical protein